MTQGTSKFLAGSTSTFLHELKYILQTGCWQNGMYMPGISIITISIQLTTQKQRREFRT